MKKKLVLKLLIFAVLVALVVSLAACGKKDPPTPPGPKPVDKTDIEIMVDKVKEIGGTINGLMNTVDSIKATEKTVANVGINVDFTGTDKVNSVHDIEILGNLNKATPGVKLGYSFTGGKNEDPKKEMFALGYIASTLYLKQPINYLNNSDATAPVATKLLLDAIGDGKAVTDLTHMLLKMLESLDLSKVDIGAMVDAMFELDEDGEIIDFVGGLIYKLVNITSTSNSVTISLDGDGQAATLISSFAGGMLDSPIVNTVINFLFDTDEGSKYVMDNFPDLKITLGMTGNTLSSADIKMKMIDREAEETIVDVTLSIKIKDFKTGASVANVLSTSNFTGYTQQLANIGLDAALPQKLIGGNGASASIDAYLNGDFSTDGKTIGSAIAKLGTGSNTVQGYFDGGKGAFDLQGVLNYLGTTSTYSKFYKATMVDTKDELAPISFISMINKAASEANAKYNPTVAEIGGEDDDDETNKVEPLPTKGLMLILYDFIRGIDSEPDREGNYSEKTEAEVLDVLEKKISEYVYIVDQDLIFNGKLTATGKGDSEVPADSFSQMLDRIIAKYKLVTKINTDLAWNWDTNDWFSDALNWIGKDDSGFDGKWIGTVYLTKADDNNDILDFVNKWIHIRSNNASNRDGGEFTSQWFVDKDTDGYIYKSFGFASKEAMKAAIDAGLAIEVSAEEDAGLEGTIRLIRPAGTGVEELVYATITGRFGFETDLTKATAIRTAIDDLDLNDATELVRYEMDGDDVKMVQKKDKDGKVIKDADGEPIMEAVFDYTGLDQLAKFSVDDPETTDVDEGGTLLPSLLLSIRNAFLG